MRRDVRDDLGQSLSSRELEILTFVRDGLSTKEIAHRAMISERMVVKHLQHICRKLGCHSWAHAVAIAMSRGLMPHIDEGAIASAGAELSRRSPTSQR